jgi:soluble lytic murein transglycosylase-like protein
MIRVGFPTQPATEQSQSKSISAQVASTVSSIVPRGVVGSHQVVALPPRPVGSSLPNRGRGSFDSLFKAAAQKEGIDEHLVEAVAEAESGFRPEAVSKAGAIGLMQLMPATARALGVNPFDPVANVTGGVKYLKNMLDRFGSVPLALAAYNAGPGAVEKYGGVPPYQETETYVDRVLQLAQRNRQADSGAGKEGGDDGQPLA